MGIQVFSGGLFQSTADFKLTEEVERAEGAERGLIVEGYATTYSEGTDGIIVTRGALESAVDDLKARPTVLFNHNQDRPIGRVLEANVDDTGLRVKAVIDPLEKEIREKIRFGTLSKFSVRGKITKQHEEWDEERRRTITYVDGLKLLEVSVVSVPAVADADIQQWYLSRNFDLTKILEEGGEKEVSEEIKKDEELERDDEVIEADALTDEELDELLAEGEESGEEEIEELVSSEEGDLDELITAGSTELLLDIEDQLRDLVTRFDEFSAAADNISKILAYVKEIAAKVDKILKAVQKYPYPYPYPYPAAKETKKGVEESEALKEVVESVRTLADEVRQIKETVIIRGERSGEEDDEKKSKVEELVTSEAYQKADPREQLRMLWSYLE